MDPLSITSACFGLLSVAGTLTKQLSSLVRQARDAREDVDSVQREVSSLSMLVEVLKADLEEPKIRYPSYLQKSLATVFRDCEKVLTEMTSLAKKISSNSIGRQIQWAVTGKEDMEKLKSRLEGYKSTIQLASEMVSMSIINQVKDDTSAIKVHTETLKQSNQQIQEDTAQLLAEMRTLREKLARAEAGQPDPDGRGFVLQRFLDQSTTYAETVVSEDFELSFDPVDVEKESKSQHAEFSNSVNPEHPGVPDKRFNSAESEVSSGGDAAGNNGRHEVHNSDHELQQQSTHSASRAQKPEVKVRTAPRSPCKIPTKTHVSYEKRLSPSERIEVCEKFKTVFSNPTYVGSPDRYNYNFEKSRGLDEAFATIKNLLESGSGIVAVQGTIRTPAATMHYTTAVQAAIFLWRDAMPLVELLLDYGADVDAHCDTCKMDCCRTALHTAAGVGSVHMTRLLLAYGASIDVSGQNTCTALQVAVSVNHPAVVYLLIRHGANVNVRNKNKSPVNQAITSGQIANLRVLIDNGADVCMPDCVAAGGLPPLHTAAQCDEADMLRLLLDNGASGDIENFVFGTDLPLYIASGAKTHHTAQILIQRGANVNAFGLGKKSPLRRACCCGASSTVQLLVDHGADVNHIGNSDVSPLMSVLIASRYDVGAAREKFEILLNAGANINAKTPTCGTVLHAAAARKQWKTVKYLVDKGAEFSLEQSPLIDYLLYLIDVNTDAATRQFTRMLEGASGIFPAGVYATIRLRINTSGVLRARRKERYQVCEERWWKNRLINEMQRSKNGGKLRK